MTKFKLLYVEDDHEMRSIVRASLPENCELVEAESVQEGIKLLDVYPYLIVLIDLILGGESGFQLVEHIKQKEFATIPNVMIVTSSDSEVDEIRGHQLEVTEYIHKPIRSSVFKALVTKYINKASDPTADIKRVGPLRVDKQKMQVKISDGEKDEDLLLTLKEYKLLMKFMDSPGVAYTREQLFVEVWDASSEIQSRTIDMHVSALRKKLGQYGQAIASVRGVGYSFNP